MALVKVSDLSGACLDWAVAQCEARSEKEKEENFNLPCLVSHFKPSSDWSQGGPIIEREGINCRKVEDNTWRAEFAKTKLKADGKAYAYLCRKGSSLLTAAMRCYAASKLGDSVELPDDLL